MTCLEAELPADAICETQILVGIRVDARSSSEAWAVACPVSGATTVLAVGSGPAGKAGGPGDHPDVREIRAVLDETWAIAGSDLGELSSAAAAELAERRLGRLTGLTMLTTTTEWDTPFVEAVGRTLPRLAVNKKRWTLSLGSPGSSVTVSPLE